MQIFHNRGIIVVLTGLTKKHLNSNFLWLCMKKRGVALSMLLASEVVAAAIILMLLMNHAARWSSTERPYQAYLAKDMALVIDSLYSSPGGNILVNYTQNASNYTVSINEEKVLLYRKGLEIDDISRKFVKTETDKVIAKLLEKPNKIQFAKIGNKIIIDNQIRINLNTLSCDKTKGESLKDKKILVDPGYEKDSVKPSNETCSIANSFIFKVTNTWVNYPNILSTRNLNEYDEDEGILSINCNDPSKSDKPIDADVIIRFRAGKDKDATKNNIKAFIVSGSDKEKESRKLACLIINSILENKALDNIKITGISIVPIDLEIADKDFPDGIKDKIFVMLEIGNTESDDGKELLKKIPELGDSISKGFIEYGK